MSLKISIIIPIFNVEKYLNECVKSVLKQTYKNIEVILVDDGSLDNCPQLCDELAQNDNRIVVIHKENGGLSDARNTGIRFAKGEYLLFLDSDDYWNGTDCLEHIVDCLHESKADVLLFGYNSYFEDTKSTKTVSYIGKREYVLDHSKEKAFYYLVEKNLYISSSGTKAVSRNLIIKNHIFFEKGATSEDIEWSARIAIAANTFDYYPYNIYVYRQREGSITKTMQRQNIIYLIDHIANCVAYAKQIKDKDFLKSYMSFVSYQYITLIASSVKLPIKERREMLDPIMKYAYLLQYGKNKKVRFVKIAKMVLGFMGMYFLVERFFVTKEKLKVCFKNYSC